MQFKHPEVLYALFLLLIPIVIHLFQLRKFQRIDFTNVAFLKKVTIQTRKSSRLKKWLTLLLRLLAFACIIIAFAQPFTASKTALNTTRETVIYIDNSFSMQAKGSSGPQLQRILQQVYDRVSADSKLHLFTNSETHKNASAAALKAEILNIPYSQYQLSTDEVLLKAEQLFTADKAAHRQLIYISDLQQQREFSNIPEDVSVKLVQTRPESINNISIDTAYISARNSDTSKLTATVSKTGDLQTTVPVSLYNGNVLVAKISADLTEESTAAVTFDINAQSGFLGRLEVNDPNLLYDNKLFFSINAPKKIKVLAINQANSGYLNRLFLQDEFTYTEQPAGSLNYNDIPDQNFIVLNELVSVPPSLSVALKSFTDNGGSLFIIPSPESQLDEYNSLLGAFGLGSMATAINQQKNISKIEFEHPLFASVFEKRVVNFQYPIVNSYYPVNSVAAAALRYEDGSPFILQRGSVYLSSAPINSANSNFQNSPLIVPTLYNMAVQSLPLPKLYFENGRENTFAIPVSLSQDEILQLSDSISSFIPLQQTKANQVLITTSDQPEKSGIYRVMQKENLLEYVSYNHNRRESNLQYANPDTWNNLEVFRDVDSLFETIAVENAVNSYWKWFVIFAVIFLLLEMLVLKFFKN